MKSSYLELTLKEFLDTITNKRIEYQIEIMFKDDESDTVVGDKYTLIDTFEKIVSSLRNDENIDTNTIKRLQRFDEIICDLYNANIQCVFHTV